jgi:hypothetical protein
METLPGMPIQVGRVRSIESSSLEYRFKILNTDRDWSRLFGDPQYLRNGETKLVWEFSQNVPFIFIVIPLPRWITNVDGVLVKSFSRFPSPRAIDRAKKARAAELAREAART